MAAANSTSGHIALAILTAVYPPMPCLAYLFLGIVLSIPCVSEHLQKNHWQNLVLHRCLYPASWEEKLIVLRGNPLPRLITPKLYDLQTNLMYSFFHSLRPVLVTASWNGLWTAATQIGYCILSSELVKFVGVYLRPPSSSHPTLITTLGFRAAARLLAVYLAGA